MTRPLLRRLLWIPALVLTSPSAHALQLVDAHDGETVQARIALNEPTRLRIDGAHITNVVGNIYSSNCGGSAPVASPGTAPGPAPLPINLLGEIAIECDKDRGEIYLRPMGKAKKPINLFVSSAQATYTLILERSDVPADTIVIRDKSMRQSTGNASGAPDLLPATRGPVHLRTMKSMLVAMASDRTPTDIRVEEVNRPVQLWLESQFTLVRLYKGRGLIGEKYLLTNVSDQPMILAEPEFDKGGDVEGASVENHNLRPGESTSVYVIRMGN